MSMPTVFLPAERQNKRCPPRLRSSALRLHCAPWPRMRSDGVLTLHILMYYMLTNREMEKKRKSLESGARWASKRWMACHELEKWNFSCWQLDVEVVCQTMIDPMLFFFLSVSSPSLYSLNCCGKAFQYSPCLTFTVISIVFVAKLVLYFLFLFLFLNL